MKKAKPFKPSMKILSHADADLKIQNAFQKIQTEQENIIYWKQRLNKKLSQIDTFILMTDKLDTAEMAIQGSRNRIEYLTRRIYEDWGRFVKVKNKLN